MPGITAMSALKVSAVVIAAAVTVTFPLYASSFMLFIVTLSLVFSIAASGLNILQGYTGLVSISQAAFFGIGSYVSAHVTSGNLHHYGQIGFGFPFWIGALSAMGLTGLIAFGIALPSFKTKGIYYIIVTLAVQLILFELFLALDATTGGSIGVRDIKRPESLQLPFLFAFSFENEFSFYYLVLVIVAVVNFAIFKLIRSPVGRAFMSIRENELRSSFMGLHTTAYKTLAFSLSGMLAGLAGSLYGSFIRYAGPDSFGFLNSVEMFAMVAIGGGGTLYGPILGSFIMLLLPQAVYSIDPVGAIRLVVLGGIILGLILFMPEGLARPIAVLGRIVQKGVTQSRSPLDRSPSKAPMPA